MKVRFLRTCAARGKHYEVGQVADLEDGVAKELCNLRRAVKLSPDVETRDPKIAIGDAAEEVIKKRGK